MTTHQHEMLSLIADRQLHQDNDTEKPLLRYWCPGSRSEWCASLERAVIVDGAGTVSSLKAMERRGWIRNETAAKYAYSITEAGRLALETHREKTGFYTAR